MPGDKPISGLDSTIAPTIGATLAATSADLTDLPIVGTELYVVGTEIGRGGMGRVLAARDRKLRRDVVIKVLNTGHDAAVARFQREALITARLQHPSIVRVYDAGFLGGEQPFYAMERVRGLSLDSVVANAEDSRGRLALLPHVIAVAEAIAYAHSEGVIHRDLKPHNVLVGSFGETVVIDWGLAKDLRSTEVESLEPVHVGSGAETIAGAVMGTPSFMPPEQARGEPADERSDIYAIGAMLYYVLCGAPPVAGERALEDTKAGSFAPLREREPETPPELASIVDRAMAYSPHDRYGTAKELAQELQRYSTGQLVKTHEYSTATLVKRWIKKHRTVLSVVTIATVLLVGFGVFSIRKIMEKSNLAERNAREVTHQMDLVKQRSDELMLDHAESVMASDPSTALGLLGELSEHAMGEPRAQNIANAAAANGVGFELVGPKDDVEHLVLGKNGVAFTGSDDGHLWGWSLASRRGDDLGSHTGPIEAVAIASNGVMLVTGGTDSMLRLWDLVTGESKLLAGHTAAIRGLAFAPDNASFVSTSEDHTVRRWSIASSEGKVLLTDKHPLRPVVWQPDGARLWVGAHDGRILELDVVTNKVTELPVHSDEVRTLALSPDGKLLASGGEDGAVFVTALADHKPRKLATHADVVRDVLWSRDGTRVISAGGDQRVVVTPLDGKPIELLGNMSGVKDLALSPDGNFVAGAGIDGVARIWPITGGEPRAFRGHRGSVKAVELTGDVLLSASDDDRVRIWPLAAPSPAPSGPALGAWIEKYTNVH